MTGCKHRYSMKTLYGLSLANASTFPTLAGPIVMFCRKEHNIDENYLHRANTQSPFYEIEYE